MKNLWALRYVFLVLAAFAAAVAGFIWAVREVPVYVCASILLIVAAVIIDRPNARRRQAQTKALVDDTLRRSYASRQFPPKLVMSLSYGYPTFEVSFESKREMEAAATCNAAFREEIAVIFKSPSWPKAFGPFFHPFDAERAVWFTYAGYLEEMRARFKAGGVAHP